MLIVKAIVLTDESLLAMVVEDLQYEDKAVFNLEISAMDSLRNAIGDAWQDEANAVAHLIVGFGRELLGRFQRLKLYQHGYLYYHFSSFLGRDLVLERIIPKEIGYSPEGESPDELCAINTPYPSARYSF